MQSPEKYRFNLKPSFLFLFPDKDLYLLKNGNKQFRKFKTV